MRAIQIARQEPGNKTGAPFGRQPVVGPEACRMQVCVRVGVCVCVFFRLAVERILPRQCHVLADIIGMVAQVELEHWQALQLP